MTKKVIILIILYTLTKLYTESLKICLFLRKNNFPCTLKKNKKKKQCLIRLKDS